MPDNNSKRCPDCGVTKSLDDFPRNRSMRDGHGAYCKPCHNARGNASRELHGGSRRYHMRRRYGMEPEDFDALVVAQGGVCAICREAPPTHLDHDHETGRVRGALCVPCNNGLGLFRDNPDLLRGAADYLAS